MTLMNKKGNLIVLSGPSGCGKGTVLNYFFNNHSDYPVCYSVSATTRQPREGEKEGVNYYYVTKDKFKEMIDNDGLLEWASFCENYYGTPKQKVIDKLNDGYDVILEIEVQGAMQIKQKMPDAVLVFILPPSFEILRERLVGRNTETEEVIKKRLNQAREELKTVKNYAYILVNDDAQNAAERFYAILTAEHLKTEKNINYLKEVYNI